jgi:hypothetical protein
MAATVTPGTLAERMTLEGRIVAAAAPETGGCEEEDQPGYKRDGNQQGDEPPDEAECHDGIIVPLSGTSRARAARRAGGLAEDSSPPGYPRTWPLNPCQRR